MHLASDYVHPTPYEGRCRVRIFIPTEERDVMTIVLTEPRDDPGMSVTNCVERLAAERGAHGGVGSSAVIGERLERAARRRLSTAMAGGDQRTPSRRGRTVNVRRKTIVATALLIVASIVALASLVGSSALPPAVPMLTAGLTTLLGLLVFVAGQIALKLVIEPIQEQRRVIGRTAHALNYYYFNHSAGTHPQKTLEEGSDRLRDLASELMVSVSAIPLYEFLAKHRFVRSEVDIGGAAVSLIELAKTLGDPSEEYRNNRAYALRAREHLGVEVPRSVSLAVGMTIEGS
jgi:hypothetical protein